MALFLAIAVDLTARAGATRALALSALGTATGCAIGASYTFPAAFLCLNYISYGAADDQHYSRYYQYVTWFHDSYTLAVVLLLSSYSASNFLLFLIIIPVIVATITANTIQPTMGAHTVTKPARVKSEPKK